MEADEINISEEIDEETNGALGGAVRSSVDVSLEEPSPGRFFKDYLKF